VFGLNIFILDYDKKKCAQYHVDKHIVKMPLEVAQLLSTAIKLTAKEGLLKEASMYADILYKPTHKNHPCSIWARQTRQNFLWLCDLGDELGLEYTHRYDKIHKSALTIKTARFFSNIFPNDKLTPFAQAMPEKYKNSDAVKAYRNYYLGDKKHLFSYKNREFPYWIDRDNIDNSIL
jgi:hypothetical protein